MLNKEPSFASIGGRRLAYDDVSPVNPRGIVLLLAGADSSRLIWYKQYEAFGRVFRTIAPDYRDTGDSDPAPTPYTIADLADDAAAVLSAAQAQRAYVVGISLGGYVALEMALRHSGQVAKLVLVATSATNIPPSPEMLAQISRLGIDTQEAGERMQRTLALVAAPGYFERHLEDWRRSAEIARLRPMSLEATARQMQASSAFDVSGRLGQIQVPTFVVHGELDPRVAPENGQYLAQHIPGARLVLYPNTGHLVIMERAEEFNRDVLAFLQE